MPGGAPRYAFAPLDGKVHDRAAFSCGVPSLDAYLEKRAAQDMRKRVAVTHVLTPTGSAGEILGYYTLSAASVALDELPEELWRKLPDYPQIGAILLGRLAVDTRHRGQGLGELLLISALERSLELSATQLGAYAVVVDALEGAEGFYQRYGFMPFQDQVRRLYLPMRAVVELLT